MTLTELRYIVALARERHFGRAAQVCYVSQPTLSVAIKKIEDELGVILFERGKQDVKVTPLGELVVAQANLVLEEARKIKEIATGGKDELKTVLRIGVIYTVGPYVLPVLIPHLRSLAPNMPLVVQEDYTVNVREKLLRGDLDVIIVSLPFDDPLINVEPIYSEPFVVLLPHQHPLCALEKIPPARMKEENVLMLSRIHCFRAQVIAACPGCAQEHMTETATSAMVEGTSLETIRYMVASGMGVTVVPMTAARQDLGPDPLLEIRHFTPPAPERVVACAWRKAFPRPKAVSVFMQAMRACKSLDVTFL